MGHPERYDDDDPILARLRTACLALPGSAEKVTHGRPCFFTKKIFAIYGATTKGDQATGRYDSSVVFQPDDDDVPALAEDDRFFVPAYWGPYGWWGLDLSGLSGEVDWDEVAELLDASFRATAPKKLIAELGETGS